MNVVVDVRNVSKTYRGNKKPALKNVSLKVEQGEIIGIIGPSGAGKSTLLRCINRLVEPDTGKILIEDKDILNMPQAEVKNARRRVGMIFQHYNLVRRLTVMQNVMHGRLGYMNTIDGVLGRYKEEDKKRAIELLRMTGLEPFMYQRANELSGGQKQRVGIVRALMQDPCILLCDEPIASLDPASARVVMDLIRTLCKKHSISCMVNLHQIDVAMEYADKIIGMSNGEIAYNGGAKELDDIHIEKIYGKPMDQLIIGGEKVVGE